MKKRLTWILTIVIVAFLVACGNNGESVDESVNDDSTLESDAATPEGTLTIYSNSLSDGRGDWLQEKAEAAGFNINLVEISGGDLINRLIAERNNPIADVVFGLNHVGFETIKGHDVLLNFVPDWADEVIDGMNDPEGYYHSTVQQAIVLVYDADNLANPPADISDLWTNADFHGNYFVNNALGGGTIRTKIAGILIRHKDADGPYGIGQAGWDAIEAYFTNAVMGPQDDTFPYMLSGDISVATLWTGAFFQREEAYNLNLGIVKSDYGVPFVVEQIGIVNGTEQEELAQAFINWFGSAEVQAAWANEFNNLPANRLALEKAPQEIVELHEGLVPQVIDWSFVQENIDDWIVKIELDILP